MSDLAANKQPLINAANPLAISSVNLLQDALDAKQPLLSDVAGSGVSLKLGTKLRKAYGTNGISVSHFSNPFDLDDVRTGQLEISAEPLNTAITALQHKTGGLSSTGFQTGSYTTYASGNLTAQTITTTGTISTPLIQAPEANVELSIRNFNNVACLSLSNATAWVHFQAGLTTGMASTSEANVPTRFLLLSHDIGMQFRCATNYSLGLTETGATVTGNLAVNGNCNITGTLTVNGQNINQAQQSTGPIAIADVTDLSTQLASKQSTLTSSSLVTVGTLTCARIKPASGTLSIADSNSVERLGVSAGSIVCSAPVSAPSIEIAGSAIVGSSLFAPQLYLAGVDISTTLAAKQATLTTTSALSVASVSLTGTGDVATAISGKQSALTTSSAVSVASVQASTGMLITGGRGGVASWGAELRVVSSNSSVIHAPPQIQWGVGGEDRCSFEYNYLGYLSHFWRASAANPWNESSRVTSTNKWTFFAGIVTPSDARLKQDIEDLPAQECLDVLRQVSAKSYRRSDLSETTRRIGYIAQDVETALNPRPSLANTNVLDTILREVTPGTTETLLTMSYDRMSVILWQCTRAMLTRIEALEQQLEQLSA